MPFRNSLDLLTQSITFTGIEKRCPQIGKISEMLLTFYDVSNWILKRPARQLMLLGRREEGELGAKSGFKRISKALRRAKRKNAVINSRS